MPSVNKTPTLGLNQWQGNEYFKREDLVNDNALIDAAIKQDREDLEHKADLIDGKVPTSQLPEMNYLSPSGDGKDVIVTFTEASARTNIATGEKLSVLFGKIKKFFTDIKTVAFTGNYADLSNKPISLPASGGNADTVNGFTVGCNVPSNAKFTDTVYTHPATHPASVIVQDANNRFVTDVEKNNWNNNKYSYMSSGDLTVFFNNSAVSNITQPALNTWVILGNYVWSNSMMQTAFSWNTLTFKTDSICSLYYGTMGNIAFNLKLEIDINGATYVGPSKFYSKALPSDSGDRYIYLTDYVFDYSILPKFIDNSPLRFRWMFYFTTVPNTGATYVNANLNTTWTFSGTHYRVAGLIS